AGRRNTRVGARAMTLKTYQGSCHCGAIKFAADIDLAAGTGKCNCTYCFKAPAWKAFVKPPAFRITEGERHATRQPKHEQAPVKIHCPTCGVHLYETGDADYMGGPFVGVFIHALDDASPEELIAAPVRVSDGKHNNWQNAPAVTGYL